MAADRDSHRALRTFEDESGVDLVAHAQARVLLETRFEHFLQTVEIDAFRADPVEQCSQVVGTAKLILERPCFAFREPEFAAFRKNKRPRRQRCQQQRKHNELDEQAGAENQARNGQISVQHAASPRRGESELRMAACS